ncbi:potassium transporter TrkH [Pacificitalea manganoxidans]|uniref:Potassium transporter TrkH n=1 Tax=Pacificitalea manganoxidans TaxID=1411902 RepID=A0A291LZL7_9RHOB|nr:potassium transporter TrkG [Pacificitalea manganoxidans]ATI42149.1 potassium transporter TrkH [Pacificitalea manganoxidans]MAQ46059.1 potassium transporter TrkH [Actibacterium sp.]MDR6308047.1 trk system potassium uptake protein TrkH [Pacificitalea manganoxidans]OWU68464.1 potassium transporter TrkH [Roseovarius sp. 22II1-1F6A]
MIRRLLDLPLIVILIGIAGVMMFVPVFHAVAVRDWLSARAFTYSGMLTTILFVLLSIATISHTPRSLARSHLIALLATFSVLPLLLAVPFYEALDTVPFNDAWFEMVSSITTTGATLFEPDRLPSTLHLWRGLVAWMGGYFLWVTAIAILAPMNLGGFEVLSGGGVGQGVRFDQSSRFVGDPRERLARYGARLLPIYTGLTGVLWIGLTILGDDPFIAFTHAMAVMSTSGISPIGGPDGSGAGLRGEMLMVVFFVFAISRQTFAVEFHRDRWRRLRRDPQMRMGLACLAVVPAILFLRHWVGAYEVDEEADVLSAIRALWGAIFTVWSFLTTTGFASSEWEVARAWSGLQAPGLVLLGLALVGGGVATTAGGVKLLRVYALYKHGLRELDKLVHPNSVGGSGAMERRIRRQGAQVAWIFFMLFALSIFAVSNLLALSGMTFEQSMVMTVAALSTTGPLAQVVGEAPLDYADLSGYGRAILSVAMVLGRLETLAIIALLNPEFWRN